MVEIGKDPWDVMARELAGRRRRVVDWLLLTGSRLWVTAGVLAVIAALLWAAVLTGLAPLVERTPILFLLFALIGGNVTLITIVVSISQFILSRHLETPGQIRQRLRDLVGYREEVGEMTGERVLPVTPGGFMLLLFRSIVRDADALREQEWDVSDAAVRRDVEPLMADLEGHARYLIRLLSSGDAGVRYALFATLDTNYSRFFYDIYRIRAEHGEALPASVERKLERLERHVEQVDVARRYFKTIFIQRELAALSRVLLYIGLPVLVLTVLMTLLFTAAAGPAIAPSTLAVTLPVVVTAAFAPLVLLAAYIVRLSTVVRRTAAMYPFTTQTTA
ncbi:MAG: hypothetical protein U5J98_03670 [Halobacteriales archaeon]|nr:hypothetical protein [Halobacteriales archaeon]